MRRTAVVDEYSEDGETVVLLADGSVLALSPLASAALAALSAGPVDVTHLAAVLLEAFGPPPGGPSGLAAVDEVLTTLRGAGVIES